VRSTVTLGGGRSPLAFGGSGRYEAMRRQQIIILTVAGIFLLLLAFALWPTPNRPFAKYVCSPVPKSVRVISFQSNDWLAANPEPVCYLAFTASADDVATVIRQGFQPTSTNASVPVPSGPDGWLTADQIGPSGRVYSRSHSPAGAGRRLQLGRNRSWSEFLWIDGTGTNVYFLLWGV
jgi:hypothetical protein